MVEPHKEVLANLVLLKQNKIDSGEFCKRVRHIFNDNNMSADGTIFNFPDRVFTVDLRNNIVIEREYKNE